MLAGSDAHALWAAALVALRVAPSVLLLSVLSRALVPGWLALGIALALAGGLSAGQSVPPELPGDPGSWLPALARELCLGLTFALATALPWIAVGWAARVAERPLGEQAPLATLYVLSAALLVLGLGGHRAYVAALSQTLSDVPLGRAGFSRQAFGQGVSTSLGSALALAVSLGIPLWIALWLLDATLALVERFAGGARELSRSPLRAALALLLFALCLAPLASRAPELVRASIRDALTRVSHTAR